MKIEEHTAHKDASPEKTVQRIQDILDAIGLTERDRRVQWASYAEESYSCLLTYINYPVLRSNGKGLTPELALASAFGEYMERLQSHSQYIYFSRIGFFPIPAVAAETLQAVPTADLHRDIPEIMKIYSHLASELPNVLHCIPFADILGEREVLVPYELLLHTVSTNGMCAGNTAEEAISQGISEIFERYVISMLFEGKVSGLPDIDMQELHIENPMLASLIRRIKEDGYSFVAKDATLGGVLPVVAIIIENSEKTKIGISFGSDPDFEIALQRCITELFQGKSDLSIDTASLKNHTAEQPIASIFNNPHLLYAKLVDNVGVSSFQTAFRVCRHNRDYLSYQMDIIRRLGKKIFIHDFSIFGFPTYQVYIEDLSCIFSQNVLPQYYIDKKDTILRTICTLEESSLTEIKELSDTVSELMHSNYDVFDIHFKKLFMHIPVIRWMDPNLLNALLHIELGEYESALNELAYFHPIEHEKEAKDVLQTYCILQLETDSDQDTVLNGLVAAHSRGVYGKVLPHLMRKNYGSFLNRDENRVGKKFDNLPLPRCIQESNCSVCNLRIRCYKESWYQIRGGVLRHAVEPDQSELFSIFTN